MNPSSFPEKLRAAGKKIKPMGRTSPWVWSLEPVHGCNLRCGHCNCRLDPLPKTYNFMAPDISKLVFRFGQWHHFVDYSGFREMKLIRKPGVEIPKKVDEYGMELRRRDETA